MVRIDIESDTIMGVLVNAKIAGNAAQRFSEQHRSAAVQNSHRLYGPVIDRHTCGKPVFPESGEFDSKMRDRRVGMSLCQLRKIKIGFPDCHDVK